MLPVADYIKPFAMAAILSVATFVSGITSARADIAIVVSEGNPVQELSRSQLVNIFLNRATEFPGNGRAMPIDQAGSPEIRDKFYNDILNWPPSQVKAYWSKLIFTGRGQPPRQASDDNEVKQLLADNPHGIGYISSINIDDSVKVVEITP